MRGVSRGQRPARYRCEVFLHLASHVRDGLLRMLQIRAPEDSTLELRAVLAADDLEELARDVFSSRNIDAYLAMFASGVLGALQARFVEFDEEASAYMPLVEVCLRPRGEAVHVEVVGRRGAEDVARKIHRILREGVEVASRHAIERAVGIALRVLGGEGGDEGYA